MGPHGQLEKPVVARGRAGGRVAAAVAYAVGLNGQLHELAGAAPAPGRERKQPPGAPLFDSALALLENESFSSLSLRGVARGAGVAPTAFYRHFASMEELGLALIDDSFRTLREMIRAARAETAIP